MTVALGIVGTSWIAQALIEASLTVDDVAVVAVHSRSARNGARLADRFAIPRIHTDLSGLAGDAEVEAVYIASPNSLHAAQAISLLRAGKHVLVEKPLAVNTAQARAMIKTADDHGRVLMEAYVSPYLPNVAALRDALPDIGTPRQAVLVKSQYSSKYDQFKDGTLPNVFNPEFGGGSLMDLGFYPISLAVHLFGEPESVTATGHLLSSGADAQGTVVLGYGGLQVTCVHSKVTSSGLGSQISGEDGVLTIDDCSVPAEVTLAPRTGVASAAAVPGFTRPPGTAEDLARPQAQQHMRYEVQEFVNLIRATSNDSPLHAPSESLATLRVLDEARRQLGVRFPADR